MIQALQRATSGIEQERLTARLDPCARPEPVESRRRRAGAEKGYAKAIGRPV